MYWHDPAFKLQNEEALWAAVDRKETYLPNLPPRITFETSKRCNLACRMCYHFGTKFIRKDSPMNAPYMDLRLIEKVAEELFPTLQYYETTLLGDPFLAPYLDDELRLAGEYGVYMRPTTNGTTVTERNIEKVDGRMDWLKCSFDSHIRGLYNAIRIGAEYETTVKRLKTFARLREQMNPVPYFRIGLVMNDMNVDTISDYIRWANEELGVDDVEIMGVNIDADYVEPMALFDKADLVNRRLDEAIDLAIDKKYKLRLDFTRMPKPGTDRFVCQKRSAELMDLQKDMGFQPPRLFERMSYVIRNPRNRHEIGDCGFVWSNNMRRMDLCVEFFNRPFVLDNGNIEGCGNCDTFLLGNLKRQNFSEIWNGDLYQDVRRKMYHGTIKENWYEPCNDCICMGVTYDRGRSDHRNRSFYRMYSTEAAGAKKLDAGPSQQPVTWPSDFPLEAYQKRLAEFEPYPVQLAQYGNLYLSDMPLLQSSLDRSAAFAVDKINVWTPLALGGRRFPKGISYKGAGEVTYPVAPGATRFRAVIGLFDGGNVERHVLGEPAGSDARVEFSILLDGKVVYTSPEIDCRHLGLEIDVPIAGEQILTLKTRWIGGDDDWCVWCDPRFVYFEIDALQSAAE